MCAIRSTQTGRTLVYAAPNPEGQRNRFRFSVSTNTCVQAVLAADWRRYGPESFTFQVLEELDSSENYRGTSLEAWTPSSGSSSALTSR